MQLLLDISLKGEALFPLCFDFLAVLGLTWQNDARKIS